MKQNSFVQGISCIIFNHRPSPNLVHPLKVLLIQREKDPFKGKWAFAGGHHEPGESFAQATVREVREETGYNVELFSTHRPDYVNEIFTPSGKHYIILASSAVWIPSNENLTSEKITKRWFNCSTIQ